MRLLAPWERYNEMEFPDAGVLLVVFLVLLIWFVLAQLEG